MKLLRRIVIGLLGGLLVALHFYSGVWATDVTLTATSPTKNTDGSPLTDLTSIRVYRALGPDAAACAVAPFTVLVTVPFTATGAAFGYVDKNQTVNGVNCYYLTAIDSASNESPMSNIASKKIDNLAPAAITDLKAN